MALLEIRLYGAEDCGLCRGSGWIGDPRRQRPPGYETCPSCDGDGQLFGQENVSLALSGNTNRVWEVFTVKQWMALAAGAIEGIVLDHAG